MNTHIFYHAKDLDGKCSGFLVKNKYPDAILHPFNYGEPFPWEEINGRKAAKDRVFMVDVSLPLEDMKTLTESVLLIWIDHHQRTIEEIRPHIASLGYLDPSVSACYLTWEFLYRSGAPHSAPPSWIHLLSLYDTWVHDDPYYPWEDIQKFQTGMYSYPTDPTDEIWRKLLDGSITVEYVISRGEVIQPFLEQSQRKSIEELAFEMDWEGYHCCMINDNGMRNAVPRGGEFDVGISFSQRKDRQWEISLRSEGDIDVSALAKKYGGGGHKNAAGFVYKYLPWERYYEGLDRAARLRAIRNDPRYQGRYV